MIINKNNKQFVHNILKKNVGKTSYGKSAYSDLWYVDNKNKICITFAPRGGASISFQQYLDLVGLLDDGLKYHNFIHEYRCHIFNDLVQYHNIEDLMARNYKFIKFIMNPYIRAVSIYRIQTSHNLSFREYLKQLINNKTDYFNSDDKWHYHQQYIEGEEKVVTKYIKINENEKYEIQLANGKPYVLDANRYTSFHHGVKNINNDVFHGDLPRNTISYFNLPKSYKYFYDDEIRKMVEIFYKDDIEKYAFKFDNF